MLPTWFFFVSPRLHFLRETLAANLALVRPLLVQSVDIDHVLPILGIVAQHLVAMLTQHRVISALMDHFNVFAVAFVALKRLRTHATPKCVVMISLVLDQFGCCRDHNAADIAGMLARGVVDSCVQVQRFLGLTHTVTLRAGKDATCGISWQWQM